MTRAKAGHAHSSCKLRSYLVRFSSNGIAWYLEPQLFPALFLIRDCDIQDVLLPFGSGVKAAVDLSYLFSWCERGDSNPHTLRYQILSLARLPIPPLSQFITSDSEHER